MTNFNPSPEQLKGALEHVYHEIAQLSLSLTVQGNDVVNNALLESRLLHVRVLLDFFQKSCRRRLHVGRELDDVLSLDYGFAPQKIGIPVSYQDRLNKDLVHLTYSRAERPAAEKMWPNEHVVLPILVCCNQFAEHLISQYLPKYYSEKLPDWRSLSEKMTIICSAIQGR